MLKELNEIPVKTAKKQLKRKELIKLDQKIPDKLVLHLEKEPQKEPIKESSSIMDKLRIIKHYG